MNANMKVFPQQLGKFDTFTKSIKLKAKRTDVRFCCFFQFCVWLHIKHCIFANMATPEILKKEIPWKSSFFENIGRIDFSKEQKLQCSQLNTTPTKM